MVRTLALSGDPCGRLSLIWTAGSQERFAEKKRLIELSRILFPHGRGQVADQQRLGWPASPGKQKKPPASLPAAFGSEPALWLRRPFAVRATADPWRKIYVYRGRVF